MSKFPHAKEGDIVKLTDGTIGIFKHLWGIDNDLCVDIRGSEKLFLNATGVHKFSTLANIESITSPGAAMTQTPYDAEIARAEKALADLKAKAVAEAAAKATPKLRWYKDVEEFMAFANSLPNCTVTRFVVNQRINGSVRASISSTDFLFITASTDVRDNNFHELEYTTDGKTWKKFGVTA